MMKRRKATYIITVDTKAIMHKDSNYYRTLILEGKEEKKSQATVLEILNRNCLDYGASFKGRRETSSYYLHSNNKLPIAVHPAKGIYFFPTASLTNKDCVWLAYHHIKRIIKSEDKTYVLFHDGTGIYINSSYYTVDNQKKRTSELIVQLNRDQLFVL